MVSPIILFIVTINVVYVCYNVIVDIKDNVPIVSANVVVDVSLGMSSIYVLSGQTFMDTLVWMLKGTFALIIGDNLAHMMTPLSCTKMWTNVKVDIGYVLG
jgi:hypothetical protein